MPFYEEQAIAHNVPLFLGIGASQIDRNSIEDMDATVKNIQHISTAYVDAIKNVAQTIAKNGYDSKMPPWPGTVYFEDISSESHFGLIETIVKTALSNGALEL
jgi:hypothetical protein